MVHLRLLLTQRIILCYTHKMTIPSRPHRLCDVTSPYVYIMGIQSVKCCIAFLHWVLFGQMVADYMKVETANPISPKSISWWLVSAAGEASLMETEDSHMRKYNRRTLRDKHGQYPVWMNQRAIKKKKITASTVRRRAKVKCGSGKKLRKWLDVYIRCITVHKQCDIDTCKSYATSCQQIYASCHMVVWFLTCRRTAADDYSNACLDKLLVIFWLVVFLASLPGLVATHVWLFASMTPQKLWIDFHYITF